MRFGAQLLALLLVTGPLPAFAQGQPAGGAGGRPPQPVQRLTYEMAQEAADSAEAEARANGWNMTIVVVDGAGVPIYLKRMTGAISRSYDFATGKARTVIQSKLSTADYAARVRDGTLQAIPEAVAIGGGLPILMDGEVVGAIAASGARPDQDEQVANAGLRTIDAN